MRVFVSYCHRQGPWVRDRLVPVLSASGCEVLVDWERFKAGRAVIGQMDGTQDMAHRHVLLLTADYQTSDYCRHEMDRAIAADPGFTAGKVMPIKLDGAPRPPALLGTGGLGTGPIYVDLQDDRQPAPWAQLLTGLGDKITLHMTAPRWLDALDQTRRHLKRKECVNLIVRGRVNWRAWREQFITTRFPSLRIVDLDKPEAYSRNGLVDEILRATAGPPAKPVPPPPDDLRALRALRGKGVHYLLLDHFERVAERPHYGDDLSRALRYLVTDDKCLAFIAHTRMPVAELLPAADRDSWPDFQTVELG